jgi:hypothetical protein
MSLFKLCVLIFAANLISAEFSHEVSEKMINFVAASFTPFMGHDYTPAYACFEKSYPKGNWYVLNTFTLNPCKIEDQCVLWIVSSDIYKKIVFSFKGAIGKADMNQTAHETIENYIPWMFGNVSYGHVNPDIYKASKEAFNYISTLILAHRSYDFAFTGHSLGGAISSLTALNVKIALKAANVSLFTYGEPRYHNYELSQAFQKYLSNGYRIVHNSDIVPHMPLCGTHFSDSCNKSNNTFYHRPQEIWYNNPSMQMTDDGFKLCSSSDGEDPACSDSISESNFLLNFATDRGIEMHMTYYNQKLDDYGISGCGEILCEDIDKDCASKITECKNSLYKPVMCKYCKKSCNLCTDKTCYN